MNKWLVSVALVLVSIWGQASMVRAHEQVAPMQAAAGQSGDAACENGRLQASVVDGGASVRLKPRVDAEVELTWPGGTTHGFNGMVKGDLVNGSNIWYFFNTLMGFRYVHASELQSIQCMNYSK
jgi:hypothetical protein